LKKGIPVCEGLFNDRPVCSAQLRSLIQRQDFEVLKPIKTSIMKKKIIRT
jgi:hypothetical protein